MRVKRLEIQGFKSFKDKTVIHFDHSITGIVGPNGCGKSNIVDAFFWVMGEQSYKHMRGNSSEDLIFNGSSKYSPLGVAEATLVMETDVVDITRAPAGASFQDNPSPTSTKEVSVTRRLYRTGEGEYFINGTLARLKDIQELFMDTGVGAKGYSVIEQGQIGKIVNAKPEERRLLIEEAAGIAKYKARKKESLRKMEATQANLARLADIIQEIEKNLGSLERQAQKARQYRKYKDELLDKEMTWGRRKSQVFRQKLDILKKQREALEQELVGLKAELQTTENSIEVDRIHLVTENKNAEALQAQIQDLASDLSHEKSALELSKRRQGDLASQLEALENEKEDLKAAISVNTERLSEIEVQSQEAQVVMDTALAELQDRNEHLNELRGGVLEARVHADKLQKELMGGMSKISDLTSRIASLASKVESARSQSERISSQIEIQNDKMMNVREEMERNRATLDEVKIQKSALATEKKDQTVQIQQEEQELKALEQSKNESLKKWTQLKSKLQSLEELHEGNEGMGDGPKAALDWAKANSKGKLLQPLTQAFDVKSGYEAVLESWLEKRIENLITEDSELALNVLGQLRNGKLGRVAVQILSSSEKDSPKAASSKKVESLLKDYGFQVVGQLSDFVDILGPYQAQLGYLVRHIFVVESSGPFADFCKKGAQADLEGWAVVSMDGVSLEAHGLLRGGSLDATGAVGRLKRKKQIEELKTQVAEAETEHLKIEQNHVEAKAKIEVSRARLQTLQNELQGLDIQIAGLERDIHQTERSLQDVQGQLRRMEKDLEDIDQERETAQTQRQEFEIELDDLKSSRSDLEETILRAQEALSEKDNLFKTEDAELQTLRIKEASLRERALGLKREAESTRSLIQDRSRRVHEVERTLERASQEQAQFSGGESELEEKIQELTLSLAQARDQLSLIKDKIEQSNAKVSFSLEKVKELHKLGDSKTSESNQLALDIEKTAGELSHLVLNLEEKYGPGCLQATVQNSKSNIDENAENADVAAPPVDISEMSAEDELALTEEVERLRERIRRLGEVNVMAIEEHETLKKRYDHLLTEKNDLEKSLKNLEEAIEHINKTSEERFRKAFEAIAERFERLFPIIFGGGQAKLSLVYPEGSTDILEAGVDILAQPPGKKVANITLLSGGEKALTAVSLIFAIFMVKPSPFCVLDEVDAPLDDANIGKFNALLREMSAKSQFILITHNKKTMELNDTLYGVTMEEPGVSKMVSIEMR